TTLRAKTGAIAFDPGYGDVGSCKSAITYIDGDKGILRYRGYPIDELATKATFLEVAYLLIYGNPPSQEEYERGAYAASFPTRLPEDMKKFFEGYPPTAHRMAVMAAMVISLPAYYPEHDDPETIRLSIIRLIAKIKTIAAFSYKKSMGQPYMYPTNA